MKKFLSISIVAIFLLIGAFGINTAFQETVGKEVKSKLQQIIKEKNVMGDLKSSYYFYASLQYLKATASDIKVCHLLEGQDLNKLLPEDIFYYYKLANAAKCEKIVLSNEKIKKIIESSNSDELDTFYQENVIGFLYEKIDKSQINIVCNKVKEFLDNSGAGKLTKKKNAEMSYEQTHKVFNIALSCFSKNGTNEDLKKLVSKAINSIVLNSFQINKDTRAIYDGKHPISTTSAILYYIKALSKYVELEDFAAFLPETLNYLSESALGLNCPKAIYSLYRALNAFQDFPLFSLDKNPVMVSKKTSIVLQCRNIYGEKIIEAKKLKVQGTLSLNNKDLGSINFDRKNELFQGEIDLGGLTELRFYDLKMEVTDGVFKYSTVKSVGISNKMSIHNFKFEVVQSKIAPKILSNEVAFGQKFKEEVAANQNSFIHIQFELKFPGDKALSIKQVAVKLRHPVYQYATNLVNAVYDSNQHVYKAVIDIGDPDHIMAYNAVYDAELVIADEILPENIKWVFAKFNISFQKPLKTAPLTDAHYNHLPLIAHNFPAPRNPPPSYITLTFCAVIAGFVLFFLGLLKGINVNFSRFPSDVRGGFFSFLFTLLIIGYIVLLCLFWVQINLFETLSVLCVLFIPTILIGNESLISLKLEQEFGVAKEILD